MLARIKITMAICISLLTSNAYSHSLNKKGPYIKAASGLVLYNKLENKSSEESIYRPKRGRTSVPIYLSLGYSPSQNIATEVSARFSRFKYLANTNLGNSRESQHMYSYSLFWNLYLKYPITRRVVPYVTFGPGLSFNRSKPMRVIMTNGLPLTLPGRDITSFAWNIGFGSELYSNNKVLLDIGYRFVSMGAIGVKEHLILPRESRQVKAHDIILGVAYKF